MKLLYITNQICGAAGLERVLSIKASYLADKLGYEIHIVTLNQGKETPLFYDFSDQLIYHDISIIGNPIQYINTYCREIKKVVNRIRPNIISVCDDGLKAFFLPTILGKPCPMVYERHVSKNVEMTTEKLSVFSKLKNEVVYFLMNRLARTYDKFVVLTNDNLKEWNLPNSIVISNPLSFYPEEQSTVKNKNVLAVGRQAFQKGYDRLLQSWKIITAKYPDWQLNIYGKFEQGDLYLNMTKELGIDDTVTFHKPIKNIGDKYNESSIYVMPSRFEGFGMVLIEAMAYGVPCVSFNCPCGPEDIISNGEDGFLVENGNIISFANHIEKLIVDQELRVEMGNKARKKATHFLPDKIIPQWNVLFHQLANLNKIKL